MAEPEFDRSNGWWFIRYRTGKGTRAKKSLKKDLRWTKGGDWPTTKARPKCPPDVLVMARPFQDLDMAARLGQAVKIPRATDLKGFLDAYRSSYVLSQRPNSVRILTYSIDRFLAFCAKERITSVEQVTRKVCRSFLEDQLNQGRKHNTIKGIKGMLGGAFSRGVEEGLIETSPWFQLPTPGHDDSDGTPSWTPEEIAILKAELRVWHGDMFVVGINCGFRREALCNLEWRDVQWSTPRRKYGRLTCRKEFSKSGKAYSVPLVDELRDVLRRRKDETRDPSPTGKIFPGRRPGSVITPTTFRRGIERACERAGIDYRGHAWHSMRATFATLAHARGVNPRTIQAWMNHSSIQMTDKYSHYSTESDDEEAKKMKADRDRNQEG